MATEILTSYADAVSPGNQNFCDPGKKEDDSIRANNTFKLVYRKPGMHFIRSVDSDRLSNGHPVAIITYSIRF